MLVPHLPADYPIISYRMEMPTQVRHPVIPGMPPWLRLDHRGRVLLCLSDLTQIASSIVSMKNDWLVMCNNKQQMAEKYLYLTVDYVCFFNEAVLQLTRLCSHLKTFIYWCMYTCKLIQRDKAK